MRLRGTIRRPYLETHIADVVNLIGYEDLSDVILVGHSYAGTVVTGVADRVADRLAQLVYLDSGPLGDGEAMLDLYPPDARSQLRQRVDELGQGWRLPFPEFEELAMTASIAGLDDEARQLMRAKATAQPFQTYAQPLRLSAAGAGDFQRVVIACDDVRALIETGIPSLQALTRAPWHYHDLATGHWPMLSASTELATLLHRLASER